VTHGLDYAPEVVRLDATWRCNLACSHCQTAMFRSGPHPRDLSTEELEALFADLAQLGTRHVSFLGGEPLLRPDLADLVSRLTSYGISSHVTTNGYALPRRARSLMAAGLRAVAVSVDGDDPATNDAIRGAGVFNRAEEAVAAALAVRDSEQFHTRVGLSVTINSKTIGIASRFLDLARSWGVDFLLVAPVHAVGDAATNWNEVGFDHAQLLDIAADFIDTRPDTRASFLTAAVREWLATTGVPVGFPRQYDLAGVSECYVTCEGRVYPSQKCSEMVPHILQGMRQVLGVAFEENSLRERSFLDIWLGRDFKAFRDEVLSRRYITSYTTCRRCPHRSASCIPSPGAFFAGESVPYPICEGALQRLGYVESAG
jgi:MoaA/NifB/PqqE/SkfB family radical SAM enzyme